jgi:hypothetical protein
VRSRSGRLFLITVPGHKSARLATVGAVYEGVNELVGIGYTPLLSEEGWTRHQENSAKPPYLERTGWSLATQVFGMHSRNVACERPPRLRCFGSFATFSYSRSHPSSVRRGIFA